jgi:hypothetical protein
MSLLRQEVSCEGRFSCAIGASNNNDLLYWLHMRHFKRSPVKAFHIPEK